MKIILKYALSLAFVVLFVNPIFSQDSIDFTFKDTKGSTVSLSDYKGKVVLVNFWATWCGPCLHEMPDLEKLNNTYQDEGLQVLGLTILSKEKAIPKKIKRTGVTYPILVNADEAVALFGGFSAVPNTFIIDRKGKVVDNLIGARSYVQFEKVIKKVLQK